jgi:hypothetical protein
MDAITRGHTANLMTLEAIKDIFRSNISPDDWG